MEEALELQYFSLIAQAGDARSCFIEAIGCAGEGKFEKANQLLNQGHAAYVNAHKMHSDMIACEAGGQTKYEGLLAMHSEDLMMSAETFEIIAEQMVDLYRRLQNR